MNWDKHDVDTVIIQVLNVKERGVVAILYDYIIH